MKRVLLALSLLLSTALCAQTDKTIPVKAFSGDDVGAKITNAMKTCPTASAGPCILVVDVSLAAFPAGTVPTLCSNCYLQDFRNGAANVLPIVLDVRSRGAKCDGVTDDQAAFNSMLNPSGGTYATFYIPSGLTCRITKQIKVVYSNTNGPSLIGAPGAAPTILADYTSWGTDPSTIFATTTAYNTSPAHNVRIQDFNLNAVNTGSIAAVGIESATSVNRATFPSSHAISYAPLFEATVRGIGFSGYNMALSVDEAWESHFEDFHANIPVINGISIQGKVVNCTFENNNLVSNSAAGTGVYVNANTYSDGLVQPEGLNFAGNLIFGFGTGAEILRGFGITFDKLNIIDGIQGNAFVIDSVDELSVENNYIGILNAGKSAVLFQTTQSVPQEQGILFSGNSFVASTNTSTNGIYIPPAATTRVDLKVIGNNFTDFRQNLTFNTAPQYSAIVGNTGNGTSHAFAVFEGNAAGTGFSDNYDNDSIPMLAGTYSALAVGNNASFSGYIQSAFPGGMSSPSFLDTGLAAGTSPVCPNGTGGALSTTGCTSPQKVNTCGTTTSCSNTVQSSPRIVWGAVTLASGTATVTGMTAWTSTASFTCTGNDATEANPVKIVNASTTSIKVAGTGSDTINYQCVGN